ncbi:MAG: transcription elongation factor GreA [Gammaproteobacteria bacterium AqS3]|nr:transcription elongation factor GreA [Gammaproteobacteria bacterium AqS3]
MKVPMTQEGEAALRGELQQLKGRRHEISREIARAREFGDLKENAEYHAARERQGLDEARIRDIENKLARAEIIDVARLPRNGKVLFGLWVQIAPQEGGDEQVVRIVGSDESDPKNGLISVRSPVAQALIGREAGDLIEVKLPEGAQRLKIIQIHYQAP